MVLLHDDNEIAKLEAVFDRGVELDYNEETITYKKHLFEFRYILRGRS